MRKLTRALHAAFHRPDTLIHRYIRTCVSALIFLSVLLLVLEATLPESSALVAALPQVDRVLLTIFGIEIALRLATYKPPALRVFRRPPMGTVRVDHARTAGADEVIETRKIGYSMLAHAVRYHGIATMMSRVLLSGAHSVYVGLVPRGLTGAVTTFGDLLLRLQLSKRGGLVVGLRTPTGQEIINPPKSQIVEPASQLLYLAREPLLEPPG